MNQRPILLVEDNVDDADLTIKAFQRHGIKNEVVVAPDGRDALDLLMPEDGSARLVPSVVLLDLNLPIVPGLEVLRRIRGNPLTELLPVVVLTTSNQEQDMVESYRFGANSYVRKPVSFAAFAEAAHVLGMYWLLLNEAIVPEASRGAGA